jgi:phosphatidylglycerol:prolipoprotein diacylglycerol transferase
MHPVLLRLGPLTLRSYGLALAAAFLAGIFIARRRARRAGYDPGLIADLSLYIFAGAIIGSRLLYVVLNWGLYRENPVEIFWFWRGGLAYQGGLAGAVAFSLWFLRKRRLSPWLIGDVVIPAVPLGHALGRIGCFLNGCCYGTPSRLPWAVTFPPSSLPALHYGPHHGIHPVQLYAAGTALVFFAILNRLQPLARLPGRLFWLYGVLYGTARFILEFFRGDHSPVLLSLSAYQLISALIFFFSAAMLVKMRFRLG